MCPINGPATAWGQGGGAGIPSRFDRWSILVLRSEAVWLGDVEATSEAKAIAKGAEEFKRPMRHPICARHHQP
jgi:hypothetical protein